MLNMVTNDKLPALMMVSVRDIARRAYELYVERGRADGFDREDWRRAEHELHAPASGYRAGGPDDSRRTINFG
jgi:hypothetical protein